MIKIKDLLEEYVLSDVKHGYNRYYERLVSQILTEYNLMTTCKNCWVGYMDEVLDVLIAYICKDENSFIQRADIKVQKYNQFSILEKETLIEDIKCLKENEVKKAIK